MAEGIVPDGPIHLLLDKLATEATSLAVRGLLLLDTAVIISYELVAPDAHDSLVQDLQPLKRRFARAVELHLVERARENAPIIALLQLTDLEQSIAAVARRYDLVRANGRVDHGGV